MASTYKKSNKRCVTNFIYDFLIILNELQFENSQFEDDLQL